MILLTWRNQNRLSCPSLETEAQLPVCVWLQLLIRRFTPYLSIVREQASVLLYYYIISTIRLPQSHVCPFIPNSSSFIESADLPSHEKQITYPSTTKDAHKPE